MPGPVEDRLEALGLTLPESPAPAANYVPYVRVGPFLHVSGQISRDESGLLTGRLGAGLEIADGVAAARTCALALLAQLKAACDGDFAKLDRVVKLTGFVNSSPDFTDQPKVINGASDLLVEILGEPGRHARSAVGVAALPLGVAVEIEAIFALR